MNRGVLRLTLAFVFLAAVTAPALAFVLEGPSHRPWHPLEDIDRAARWDANQGSLVETGERGLGGGIEYSIDESLCTRLTFLDAPAPSCDQIKAALQEALDRWTVGSPTVRFTDVSTAIPVAMQGRSPSAVGKGAELDFIAVDGEQFPSFLNPRIAAMAIYYYDEDKRPILTTGQIAPLSLGTLTAADVRLSTRTCYFLDPAFEQVGCAHFGSLIKHEVGHVLGVEHPDQFPDRNLAPESAAAATGCALTPIAYTPNAAVDPHAAAQSVLYGAAIWRHGLTQDDFAARDALYPTCAPASTPVLLTAEAPITQRLDAEPALVTSAASLPDLTLPADLPPPQ